MIKRKVFILTDAEIKALRISGTDTWLLHPKQKKIVDSVMAKQNKRVKEMGLID